MPCLHERSLSPYEDTELPSAEVLTGAGHGKHSWNPS